MTIEEKAKAYDEAIEKLRSLHDEYDIVSIKEELEHIFPQLKESEDEKIRKALISAINNICNSDEGLVTFNGFSKEQVLAWLEKQGEASRQRVEEAMQEVEEKAKIFTEAFQGKTSEEILAEMRGEQKTFDYENANIQQKDFAPKVEPKFHKGDWVVWDNKICCHIDNIYQGKESLMYTITDDHNMTRSYSIKGFDNNAHLWTIQDAKDGDVLAALDYILIFKEFLKNDGGISYCHYDFGAGNPQFIWTEDKNWYFGKEAIIHPATKEQRDLLFQKMKEAGYEWDAEKKELKKMEQKTEWGEEDEEMLRRCISATFDHGYLRECDWLKSLKDRGGCAIHFTTTKAWSEEDEINYNYALAACKYYGEAKGYADTETHQKADNWLKSLKERIGNFDDVYKVGFSAAKHNQWKPSDEQMQVLQWCMPLWSEPKTKAVLESLIADLKKL